MVQSSELWKLRDFVSREKRCGPGVVSLSFFFFFFFFCSDKRKWEAPSPPPPQRQLQNGKSWVPSGPHLLSLFQVRQHDDGGGLLLPDHPPEVIDRLLLGACKWKTTPKSKAATRRSPCRPQPLAPQPWDTLLQLLCGSRGLEVKVTPSEFQNPQGWEGPVGGLQPLPLSATLPENPGGAGAPGPLGELSN